MKTMKLTLVALIVAFAATSIARADGITEKPKFSVVKHITLEKAKKNPGMVNAMYSQLDLGKLVLSTGKIYVGEVKFHGQVYRITGSYGEWLAFFRLIIIPPTHYRDGMKGVE
jgi:hypothetical protein